MKDFGSNRVPHHPNDIRRAENRAIRQLQHKFPPGTLRVTHTSSVFTVVSWTKDDKDWRVLVVLGGELVTWELEELRWYKTLKEGDDGAV